jgi:predicted Zn-dependent protease
MPARTPRMQQLEELLALDPADAFVHYALAMEYATAGDEPEAARRLRELASSHAYVPAFLQAGQVLARIGRAEEAAAVLRQGVAEATRQGDTHAAGEMAGLLATLE